MRSLFSLATSLVAGSGATLKKASKTFALVEAKAEVVQDIGADLAGDDFGSDDNARRVKPERADVKATVAYFSTVIRQVLASA